MDHPKLPIVVGALLFSGHWSDVMSTPALHNIGALLLGGHLSNMDQPKLPIVVGDLLLSVHYYWEIHCWVVIKAL